VVGLQLKVGGDTTPDCVTVAVAVSVTNVLRVMGALRAAPELAAAVTHRVVGPRIVHQPALTWQKKLEPVIHEAE
jgi:hypothetical protein